jgi:hypothetical protein
MSNRGESCFLYSMAVVAIVAAGCGGADEGVFGACQGSACGSGGSTAATSTPSSAGAGVGTTGASSGAAASGGGSGGGTSTSSTGVASGGTGATGSGASGTTSTSSPVTSTSGTGAGGGGGGACNLLQTAGQCPQSPPTPHLASREDKAGQVPAPRPPRVARRTGTRSWHL